MGKIQHPQTAQRRGPRRGRIHRFLRTRFHRESHLGGDPQFAPTLFRGAQLFLQLAPTILGLGNLRGQGRHFVMQAEGLIGIAGLQ